MASSSLAVFSLLLAFSVALTLVWLSDKNSRKRVPLPPQPKGTWLQGNEVPPRQWLKFYEYTKQYGPLFSLRLHRQTLIVVGTYKAAYDILEKEGISVIDRPRCIAANDMLSGGMRILLLSNGSRLKKMRRALHTLLQPAMARKYQAWQMRGARNLLRDIMRKPEEFQDHAKRYAASVIISLTYGKPTSSSYTDPEVVQINKNLPFLGRALKPGRYAVDSYPILRWWPWYAPELRAQHQVELGMFKRLYKEVQKRMDAGDTTQSFTRHIIEQRDEYSLTENEAAYLCGTLFGAGSDTTAAAIPVVMMALAHFPDVQHQAREALDSIVGRDRLPTFDDHHPYITALILESYRWRPVTAGGFYHRASRDIIYDGMLIPKGASVVGNHWAISRDPDVYPEPESFNPSRWLVPSPTSPSGLQVREDIKSCQFGFGRRVCPGLHIANRSLHITTCSILWAFYLSEDEDEPIEVMNFTDTTSSHPMPFKVKFKERDENVRRIVDEAKHLDY